VSSWFDGADRSPECLGLPCASLYIALMMLFIPFPFSHIFAGSNGQHVGREYFPQGEVG
jgi:UDP-N-acetylglucosamine--dolichyl-phosphate N-acetylglucosaminephosphotransferase